MKLLILSFYFTPDLSAGSFRMQALCNEIIKNHPDVDVDILTTKPNRYHSYSKKALCEEKYNNIKITRFNVISNTKGMLGQILSFIKYSFKAYKYSHKKEYDLVFATSSRLMTASLGAFLANRIGAKLYLDVRDLFLDTILSLYTFKAKIFLLPVLKILEKYTFSRAFKINLVSEGFQDYVKKNYPKPSLAFYTNGIDEIFLPPLNSFSNQPKTFNQKDGVIKILYAGNLGEGQVIDKILPNLCQVLGNQYEFIVIGDGSRKKNLLNAVDKKQLNNVSILDPVPRDELVIHYKNADILFLHLDDNQAFKKVLPSKIFEYAATGKPIIAGVAGYPERFINEHLKNAKVFPPCNYNFAKELFNDLEIISQPRDAFVDMFARSKIMQKFAEDIISNSIVNDVGSKNDI